MPVNKIAIQQYSEAKQAFLNHEFQTIIGSLNWLATFTRPDLSTITNILANYSSHASNKGHVAHMKHALRSLKGTRTLGISSIARTTMCSKASLNFPSILLESLVYPMPIWVLRIKVFQNLIEHIQT